MACPPSGSGAAARDEDRRARARSCTRQVARAAATQNTAHQRTQRRTQGRHRHHRHVSTTTGTDAMRTRARTRSLRKCRRERPSLVVGSSSTRCTKMDSRCTSVSPVSATSLLAVRDCTATWERTVAIGGGRGGTRSRLPRPSMCPTSLMLRAREGDSGRWCIAGGTGTCTAAATARS